MASDRILFVDDDPNILAALQRNLRNRYVFDVAGGGEEALALLRTGSYAVIVVDMSMPVMTGVQLLETMQKLAPETVRVMLTGNSDQASAVAAVNRGAVFRFLSKPCPYEILAPTLDTALKHHELLVTEKALLSQTLNGSLQVLTDILAMLDADAFGQAQLRRRAVREVARQLGLESTWAMETAALLAEIGRVTLPPTVQEKLRSQQPLSPSERQLVERVPEFSARLLRTIPRLEPVVQIVLYQHKNFNGTGFPADPVRGNDIPLGARLLRAVDSMVSMLRRGTSAEDALSAIKAGPERYDPGIVQALSACKAVFRAKPEAAAAGMRNLPLQELAPGHILLSDVVSPAGSVLLPAGTALNAAQIQRLRNIAALSPFLETIAVEVPPAGGLPGSTHPQPEKTP